MLEREVTVRSEDGIQVRMAAALVQKAQELSWKYDCQFYIRGRQGSRCEMDNLMKLIALRVACGDTIFVAGDGERRAEALAEMMAFLADECEMEVSDVPEAPPEKNDLTQEELKAALEKMQEGICMVDDAGKIVYVNPAYLQIAQMTSEQVLGKNIIQMMQPPAPAPAMQSVLDFPDDVVPPVAPSQTVQPVLDGAEGILPWEEYEKQIIAKALEQGGSFNAAGKLLHITHKTVAAKARKYGLV